MDAHPDDTPIDGEGNPSGFTPLTAAHRRTLRDEIKRTGVNARRLIQNHPGPPDGLTSSMVNRWLSGMLKQARQSDLDFILGAFAALPHDAGRRTADGKRIARVGRRPASDKSPRVPLTEEMVGALRAAMWLSGADFQDILVDARDMPPGLNLAVVRSWLYRKAKTADAGHWGYVMARIATLSAIPKTFVQTVEKS